MRINFEPISNVVGVLLLLIAASMLACIPVSLYFESGDEMAFVYSALAAAITGGVLWRYRYDTKDVVKKREGYMIVTLSWLLMIVFSSLPYIFSGTAGSVTNAIFESASGLTTTGASIMTDIESLPHGILFWRSLTQWIGGMGIIVLTVALFPLLGIGGIELFVAEAPGPTSDKLHPRIKETAKRLWFIYLGFTVLLAVIFVIEGMTVFDAINHALTTMATGGFSTKNDSMAHFSPTIQYTTALFMFFAGTNYTVLYFALMGKFRKVWNFEELRFYIVFVALFVLMFTFGMHYHSSETWEASFRNSLFSVISLMTTTGFATVDYTDYVSWLTMLSFILIFVGACAGSTAGGIKLIRHLVLMKNTILEFKRLLHPRAMIRTKINKQLVAPRVLTHIMVFLLVYLFVFIVCSVLITIAGMDFVSAIGASATCLSNVGPGLNSVGPVSNFHDVPDIAKWILSFEMVLGRLELFTVLILFTPFFWKAN